MKEIMINKLKNKTVLFWLDSVLPLLPIISFIAIGVIFYNVSVIGGAGWLIAIIPTFFTTVWAVWYYKIRSKLNIPETQSLFWKVFGRFF